MTLHMNSLHVHVCHKNDAKKHVHASKMKIAKQSKNE